MKTDFGKVHRTPIHGRWVEGPTEFEDRSPIDTRILIAGSYHATASRRRKPLAPRKGLPRWSRVPWEERVSIVRRIADGLRERRADLSALIGYRGGQESFGVRRRGQEAIDFFDSDMDLAIAPDSTQPQIAWTYKDSQNHVLVQHARYVGSGGDCGEIIMVGQ